MTCSDRLSQWTHEVSTAFAHLSQPQRRGLVLWSVGIALCGAAGISQISALLAQVLGQREQTVFQRLREWYLNGKQKSGKKRREVEVTSCFGPLLGLVLRWWDPGSHQLALVADATTLGKRWTVLSISVVLRSGAIPVAWKVVGAEEKGSWRPHWEGLLQALAGVVPVSFQVMVLADRGLYAHWLWTAIQACGWHPFLRINLGVKARLLTEEKPDWISRWLPEKGRTWKQEVECFVEKRSRVRATLLLCWQEGYCDPWVVLTDLPPEQAEIGWYGMRSWVECGFKDFKRGLWGWHHSKMKDASGVERLWLVIALAQLWTMSLGCQAEESQPAVRTDLPASHVAVRKRKRPSKQSSSRRLSCVVRGRISLLASLFTQEGLPLGRLLPLPWPEQITPSRSGPTSTERKQRERQRLKRHQRRARQKAQRSA